MLMTPCPRKAGLCPRRGLVDDGPPVCLVPAARCDALPLPAGDGRDAEIVKLRQDAAEQFRQAQCLPPLVCKQDGAGQPEPPAPAPGWNSK